MKQRFGNKVAIITGGSDGIGLGISQGLAAEGALVYLVARKQDKLESAKKTIQEAGGKAEIRVGDITSLESIKTIVNDVYKIHQRIDVFVNNAGEYRPVNLESPLNELDAMLALDFIAPYKIGLMLAHTCKATHKPLQLLTVASQASLKVFPNGLGYGVAKTALLSGLLHLQTETEKEGVPLIQYRLYPGTVATPKALDNVRKGLFQNPTTLESVVDTALDLLADETPTRDAYVGYIPGEGIVRRYFNSDSGNASLLQEKDRRTINKDFDPKTYFK